MAKPAPQSPPRITPETIGQMAAEVLGTPLKENDRQAVADMVQSLLADMTALRQMDVGEAEPAVVYDAAEVKS